MTRKATNACLIGLLFLFPNVPPAYAQRAEVREAEVDTADGAAAAAAAAAEPAGERPDVDRVEEQVVRLTNEFRAEQGRERVKPNEELKAAAQYFADYMARTGRYGHTADGDQPSQRARKHGYDYCLVSENIAYQYNSGGFKADELAKQFTRGWIESPGHRENMLEPAVVDTAVAVARAENGTYYAVQMFGRPASMRIEFKVKNESRRMVGYTLGDRTFSLPPGVTRTHERCRPGELRFDRPAAPDGQEKPDAQEDKVFHPKSGSAYIVEAGQDGGVTVREQ